MDRLLDNAMESIRIEVEDYETQEEARSRSAVRNLHAGLLLPDQVDPREEHAKRQ